MFLGPFASRKQPQTEVKVTQPFRGLENQQAYTENLLRGSTAGSRVGGIGGISDPANPFVGAGPQQQRALGQMENWYGEATPAFSTGVGTIEKTAGGGYLDPAQSAPFQRMSDARLNLARQMFGEFAPQYSSAATARGVPFSSSAREAGVQRGAERIGTQAAQDVAQAGWQQYGAERQAQEAAARAGAELAPGLAQRVFTGGEQLRGAEQAANTAQMQAKIQAQGEQMRGQLAAMGLDQRAIENVLRYMRLRAVKRWLIFRVSLAYGEWSGVVKDVGEVGLRHQDGRCERALDG